jgi:hypothetical protein
MRSFIQWFDVTKGNPAEHGHEWEGLDNRFVSFHFWIGELMDSDPDRTHSYILEMSSTDYEDRGVPLAIHSSLASAQYMAERIAETLNDIITPL